jgi:uncharacterized phage protein (TIGR01671 family)
MREIKFRAWIPQDKKMFQVGNLVIPKGLNELGDQELGVAEIYSIIKPHHYIQPVIMQYTGLNDKQGKEIYEGDIVKWLGFEVRIRPVRIHVVANEVSSWIQSCFELRNIISGNNTVEVIGNIWENPELLAPNSKG